MRAVTQNEHSASRMAECYSWLPVTLQSRSQVQNSGLPVVTVLDALLSAATAVGGCLLALLNLQTLALLNA